jgi:hypothetical protein
VSLHVRGTVVLERLQEKTRDLEDGERTFEPRPIDPAATPLIAKLTAKGHRLAAADEYNFEYGLNCILDHASRLIGVAKTAKPAPRRARKSAAKR